MKRAVALAVLACSLVAGVAALAGDGQSGQNRAERGERVKSRLQNLTPEQRAELKEKLQNMSEQERAAFRANLRQQAGGGTSEPQSAFTRQVASLKQEHQAAMTELRAIRQLALKEKATETTQALDRLIARHEKEFQKKVEALQQRMKRSEAARKGEGGKVAEPESRRNRESSEKRRDGEASRQRDRAARPR